MSIPHYLTILSPHPCPLETKILSPSMWVCFCFVSKFICIISFFKKKYLFIWLCQVLVASCRIFSCSIWDLVPSLTRDGSQGPPALGVLSPSHWTNQGKSMSHFFLDFTYKGCDTICLLLYLTDFTQYDDLWVHPCCHKWHYFIFFNDNSFVLDLPSTGNVLSFLYQ